MNTIMVNVYYYSKNRYKVYILKALLFLDFTRLQTFSQVFINLLQSLFITVKPNHQHPLDFQQAIAFYELLFRVDISQCFHDDLFEVLEKRVELRHRFNHLLTSGHFLMLCGV